MVPPYAAVRASINAAAVTYGGLTVVKADSIQLSGLDTAQWTSQRWELYAYPVGMAAPAGWSTAADGTYFSTVVLPPVITAPGVTVWGKIGVRLTVNGGLLGGMTDAQMVDTATSFSILALSGQRENHALETNQFGAEWGVEYRRNLKAIESCIGVDATSIVTAPAGPATILKSYALLTNLRAYCLRARVQCISDDAVDSGAWDLDLVYTRSGGGVLTNRLATVTLVYRTAATLDVTQALTAGVSPLSITVTNGGVGTQRWFICRESFLAPFSF